MNTKLPIAAIAAAGMALGGTAVLAQEQSGERDFDITTWDYSYIYGQGLQADALLENDVYDQDGDEIGEVEDIIIGPDGQIRRLVVEAGGFLDIGDTHFAVSWDEATLGETGGVTVPFNEANIGDYSMFNNIDDQPAEGRNWRVKELLGDYVTSGEGDAWGLVEDVVFNREGALQAVIVGSDAVYGFGNRYAFPWSEIAGDFEPGNEYLTLPYGESEIVDLEPFDYEAMQYPNVGP
jgi:sporulation protein YlmC with PRC-barrel domain